MAIPEVITRKNPSEVTRRAVWAAAAGRCTFCNRRVIDDDVTGEPVSIGELAHNVGATTGSPRGDSELNRDERAEAENLLLVCRTCHKPIDADEPGVVGRYTVAELLRFKREHEERIEELTEVGRDRAATVLRMVSRIRDSAPELSWNTVLTAAVGEGLFPQRLPGEYKNGIEIDLRHIGDKVDADYFQRAKPVIDAAVSKVQGGIHSDHIKHLAVLAFARIPLLVYLGARLDDKIPTSIFQRHRTDATNAWRWPTRTDASSQNFDIEHTKQLNDSDEVAVIINLSGTISPDELPAEIGTRHNVYTLRASQTGPAAISSLSDLAAFELRVRDLIDRIESRHPQLANIAVFASVPLSAAITIGRVLMPDVSPALHVYDRGDDGKFFFALEVKA